MIRSVKPNPLMFSARTRPVTHPPRSGTVDAILNLPLNVANPFLPLLSKPQIPFGKEKFTSNISTVSFSGQTGERPQPAQRVVKTSGLIVDHRPGGESRPRLINGPINRARHCCRCAVGETIWYSFPR